MPNLPHEHLHHVFRNDTALFSRTLRLLEIPFPRFGDVTIGNIDATETKPLSRAVDTMLRAETEDGPYLIIIEAQNKPDSRKLRNWAYYPAYLHEHTGHPVVVIVVCRDVRTAAWAREPYLIGLPTHPSVTATPIVFGPDNLPRIVSEEQVLEDPYLAALCTIAFAHDPDIAGILKVTASALESMDDLKAASNLLDFILRGLEDTPAQDLWRDPMVIPIKLRLRSELFHEGEAAGEAAGKAVGKAESVLHVLDRRGIGLSSGQREQIAGCSDLELLDTWLDQALDATRPTDLSGLGGDARASAS